VQDDSSVLASGPTKATTDYTMTIPVKSTTISGLQIEAMVDDALTMFGPGLNPSNGNFVVTEVQVSYTTAADPKKVIVVKLTDAKTDFNQSGFDVKNAINGKLDRSDKAWAVGGQERRPHWARFQLEKPLTIDDKGATLTVKILNRYSAGDYALGKFRIATTSSTAPLELGLPSTIAAAIEKPVAGRSKEEVVAVADYFRDRDVDYLTKRFEWVKQKRPLPGDAKMQQLKAALVKTQLPLTDPGELVQLRKDIQMSIAQSADRRLTGAQDLTWALINNPAFLFNH
jgi:hypothetical protein